MIRVTSFCRVALCVFFCFFAGSSGQVDSQLYDQEHQVLLSLKKFWKDPPAISYWTSTTSSHCTWDEIRCTDNSVTGLLLGYKNITDIIPSFLSDLRNLTSLDLTWNYIPGGFPRVLYNCSKLQFLDLSQNYFVGPIPGDVDRLSRLQHLNLVGNNFSADIPASIGRLSELRLLYLHQNQFNGTFPVEISNLSNLEKLSMADNTRFVPMNLPSNFTQLRKLTYLFMRQSNLIGEIPESIGDMAALEFLDLSSNSLTGNLPIGLFKLKNLSILYLFKNQLSGGIPSVIETTKLTQLDLSENNFTGTLPSDFGKLQQLTQLTLFKNQFSGEIPPSIGRLPELVALRLYENNFSGALPADLGRYSALQQLDVSINRLNGSIPENLCSGGEFFGLAAYDNNLSGGLPESFGNCSSLSIVNVYNNSLSGIPPGGFWTALNLTTVLLYNNALTGELPARVSANLSRLEISNNKFYGIIPPQISSWRKLQVFYASNNLLTGPIPQELTSLPALNAIALDQNQLSGNLTVDKDSLKSLTILHLSHNQLSGEIPEEIGLLPVLTDLDLSVNQFSGQIPAQLGKLKFSFLNLSSNHLSGTIPTELEISAYENSFLNNPGLCSRSNSPLNINVCNSRLENSSKLSPNHLALIISSTVAVFVLSVICLLYLIRFYKNRNLGVDSAWKLTAFQKLNFSESTISSGLSEKNLIGSGGSGKVYCVPVDRQGDVVAVKRIWNNRKVEQKLEKQFMAEVEILSSIRHCNIVKLFCVISNDNTKLLVYEFLKNQSLDKWLHRRTRPSGLSVLDWSKRVQIAIGAARGLCYMHFDCSPPVIHRDLKSSNILLDSEFHAKIADFGLAQILNKQGVAATMSSVAGSFGYIAPEYARTTRVNEKIDVYSFGVILLELVTGKEAHEGDEYTNLADWAWRHVQEGKAIAETLDEDIVEPVNVEEMSFVFKLGILCTATQPSSRPSMKDVLQILQRCITHQSSVREENNCRKSS